MPQLSIDSEVHDKHRRRPVRLRIRPNLQAMLRQMLGCSAWYLVNLESYGINAIIVVENTYKGTVYSGGKCFIGTFCRE